MDDLYAVLGVGRDATPAQIKNAFRKLARRYHPDRNPGDENVAARYHAIVLAYETLSDPDRRARYDRGENPRAATPPQNALVTTLAPAFMTVLQQCHAGGGDPKKIDFVARMTEILKTQLTQANQRKREYARAREILETAADRFTSDDDENLLASLTRSQLNGVRDDEQKVRADIDAVTAALKYLKRCRYRTDGPAKKSDPADELFKMFGAFTASASGT